MIRIVDYKVDDETERALLTQSILEIVRDTIGIRFNYKNISRILLEFKVSLSNRIPSID